MHKRLHVCGKQIDGPAPLGVIRVGCGHETLECGRVLGTQRVQIEIVLSGSLVVKLPDQNQSSLVPEKGTKIKPLLNVWLRQLEIRFALLRGRLERGRKGGEPDARRIQKHGFGAGRIKKRGTHRARSTKRDGLLIKHLRARLAAHSGQAGLGERQGLAHAQGWRKGRPHRPVHHG